MVQLVQKKVLKELNKDGIQLNQTKYDSMTDMLVAFYNGDVDSIIINESSREQITDIEEYALNLIITLV